MLLAVYSYDVLSRRTGITRGNGTATTYPSYDAASRLLSLSQNLANTNQDLTLNFSYTDASQLSARASSNTLYDWTIPPINRAYVPNGLNRYASVAGTAYGYDANGNLTGDGVRTLTYDVENRLRTVTGGAGLTLTYGFRAGPPAPDGLRGHHHPVPVRRRPPGRRVQRRRHPAAPLRARRGGG